MPSDDLLFFCTGIFKFLLCEEHTIEHDLENFREFGGSKPPSPAARAKTEWWSAFAEKFKAFSAMADDERLAKDFAIEILQVVREQVARYTPVPGVPDTEAELVAFDGWTVGLLRKAIQVRGEKLELTPEELLKHCVLYSCGKRDEAANAERASVQKRSQWKLLLQSATARRMLLQPDLLDKVSKYGSGLERSFFKTLHEVQRLQAVRSGAPVPVPAALDADLTIQKNEALGLEERNEAA